MKKRSVGIIASYIYTFLNMVCGLLMSSFLIRQLGDTEYGLYQTVTSFATYLVMLEFGTGTVMSRNISLCRGSGETEKLKNNISTLWYTAIFLSTLIALVSIIFYLNIGNIYKNSMSNAQVIYAQKIFIIITIYLIVSFLINTLNGLLLGMEHYTFSQKVNITKIISRTILLTLLVSLHPRAISIVIVDLLMSCCIFIFTFIYCKRKYSIKFKLKYFDKEILKNSLPLCFALLLQAFINQANTSIGKFIIGIKLNLESVALYSVVQYIYNLLSSITTIPISMYLPQIAKDIAKGLKEKELTKTLVAPCRLVVMIGGTLLFGFFAVGRQFITIFYGSSKQSAWIFALILSVPMFVNMTNGVILNVLDATNKRIFRSVLLIATTALNILITLFLISDYGIWGVVIGSVSSLIIGNILIMNTYYKFSLKLNVIWLYIQAYKGLLPLQIACGVVSYFISLLLKNVYLSFFIGGSIYVILCITTILFFGLSKTEKSFLKESFSKNSNL